MKRQTIIDISKYILREAEQSFCPCGRSAFLLTAGPGQPAFYLCVACGRVAQAGVGEVAPPEAGISKAVEDGAVFGEEAEAACEASRRTMQRIGKEDAALDLEMLREDIENAMLDVEEDPDVKAEREADEAAGEALASVEAMLEKAVAARTITDGLRKDAMRRFRWDRRFDEFFWGDLTRRVLGDGEAHREALQAVRDAFFRRGSSARVRLKCPAVAPMCETCGGAAERVSGAEVYPHRSDLYHKVFWRCRSCGASVGCHPGTAMPLGTLANAATKRARMEAHAALDRLWRGGEMKRGDAYAWLARELGVEIHRCHIGRFDAAMCARVVEACRRRNDAGKE